MSTFVSPAATRHGHLTPAKETAAEYAGMLEKARDQRFGGT